MLLSTCLHKFNIIEVQFEISIYILSLDTENFDKRFINENN